MSRGNSDVSDNTYGPITVNRRTLTKLAGMAGVAVFVPSMPGGAEAANTQEVNIQMNITPLHDNVLVQVIESEDRTPSGGPGTSDEFSEGIVRATADDLTVSEGEKILFSADAGTSVSIAGEEHLIIDEAHIAATVQD